MTKSTEHAPVMPPSPERPNKAPEPTTMAVTIRAPSSTARASHGRGSSLTLGKKMKRVASPEFPRPLSPREKEVIEWLISNGEASDEAKRRFLAQLEHATVVRR